MDGAAGADGWPNNEGAGCDAAGLAGSGCDAACLAGSGCSAGKSSLSSIDSTGGLVLPGVDTISSKDVPKLNIPPPEGFSGLGASFTAVPSPLNVEPSWKLPKPRPFDASVLGGGKAVFVSGWPKADEPDSFANGLSPVAGLPKEDSPAALAKGD